MCWFKHVREIKHKPSLSTSPLSSAPVPLPPPYLTPAGGEDGGHLLPENVQDLNVRLAKSSIQDPYIKSIHFPFPVCSTGKWEFPHLNLRKVLLFGFIIAHFQQPVKELNSPLGSVAWQMCLHLPDKTSLATCPFFPFLR